MSADLPRTIAPGEALSFKITLRNTGWSAPTAYRPVYLRLAEGGSGGGTDVPALAVVKAMWLATGCSKPISAGGASYWASRDDLGAGDMYAYCDRTRRGVATDAQQHVCGTATACARQSKVLAARALRQVSTRSHAVRITGVDTRSWHPSVEDGAIVLNGTFTLPATLGDMPNVTIALWLPDARNTSMADPRYSIQLASARVWDADAGHNVLARGVAIDDATTSTSLSTSNSTSTSSTTSTSTMPTTSSSNTSTSSSTSTSKASVCDETACVHRRWKRLLDWP